MESLSVHWSATSLANKLNLMRSPDTLKMLLKPRNSKKWLAKISSIWVSTSSTMRNFLSEVETNRLILLGLTRCKFLKTGIWKDPKCESNSNTCMTKNEHSLTLWLFDSRVPPPWSAPLAKLFQRVPPMSPRKCEKNSFFPTHQCDFGPAWLSLTPVAAQRFGFASNVSKGWGSGRSPEGQISRL